MTGTVVDALLAIPLLLAALHAPAAAQVVETASRAQSRTGVAFGSGSVATASRTALRAPRPIAFVGRVGCGVTVLPQPKRIAAVGVAVATLPTAVASPEVTVVLLARKGATAMTLSGPGRVVAVVTAAVLQAATDSPAVTLLPGAVPTPATVPVFPATGPSQRPQGVPAGTAQATVP